MPLLNALITILQIIVFLNVGTFWGLGDVGDSFGAPRPIPTPNESLHVGMLGRIWCNDDWWVSRVWVGVLHCFGSPALPVPLRL